MVVVSCWTTALKAKLGSTSVLNRLCWFLSKVNTTFSTQTRTIGNAHRTSCKSESFTKISLNFFVEGSHTFTVTFLASSSRFLLHQVYHSNHLKLSYGNFTSSPYQDQLHQVCQRKTTQNWAIKILRLSIKSILRPLKERAMKFWKVLVSYPSNPFKDYPHVAMDHQAYRSRLPRKGLLTIKCLSLITLVENLKITLLIRPLERWPTKFLSNLTYFKKIIHSFNYHFTVASFRRKCLLLP